MANTKNIDYTAIFTKYPGKWVALKEDEETVISHAEKAKLALKRAQDKGNSQPILLKVPAESLSYVGAY